MLIQADFIKYHFFSIRVVNSWNKLPEEVILQRQSTPLRIDWTSTIQEYMGHKRHCLYAPPLALVK